MNKGPPLPGSPVIFRKAACHDGRRILLIAYLLHTSFFGSLLMV